MKAQHLPDLWRHFGSDWVMFRLTHAARMRLGLVRRKTPLSDWAAHPLKELLIDPALVVPEAYLSYRKRRAPRFFFDSSFRDEYQPYLESWDKQAHQRVLSTPQSLSEDLAQGTLSYFGQVKAHIGFPPDWHLNPFTGLKAPSESHWTEIGDYDHGDIKIFWEPSRFGFAYALVRAYWRTGDERYAEWFWRLVEDWRIHNPPQRGVNWKCGQEISFRVMAWCFGLYGFLDSQATSADRVAMLAQMIAVSGQRIEANIDYAFSQRNNHGISEATGLFTIGALFPEFNESARLKRLGREALEQQGRELIYDDGSFSQHSVNYHRLMLQDFLWAMRLGDLGGEPFSEELKQRVQRAGEFLYQIQDDTTGRAPCYGQSDGSLILPLSNSDYQDLRPVVQSVTYYSRGVRTFESGPWDEDLLWLFGREALSARVEARGRSDLKGGAGGYYTLRSQDGFAFVRCAAFRDRPSQADMLHVDLWWKGVNVALDPGTYSYNAPAPWNNPLAHTAYHNTVTVDDLDQMDRASNFVWVPWQSGRVRALEPGTERFAYFEGEHDGYRRLKSPVNHRRAILKISGERWLIADLLLGRTAHRYRLHWLLPDAAFDWDEQHGRLALQTEQGEYHVRVLSVPAVAKLSLVRADEASPRGWCAPYYNYREPALSLAAEASGESHVFLTLFSPRPCGVRLDQSKITLEADGFSAEVSISSGEESRLLRVISVNGASEDR